MTATTAAPARQLQRSALLKPKTADEATRSVELVVATERLADDGVILRCAPGAVSWPAVVPVLMDHQNSTDRMAGRLEALRFEAGQLIGRAVFTDAPAADAGWALARSGCAVSVGAQLLPAHLRSTDRAEVAERWTLRHAALTPQGMDPDCLTRSVPNPEAMTTTTAPAAADPQEVQRTAAEIKRENRILRAAQGAGLNADETDELLRSDLSADRAVVRVIEIMRDRQAAPRAGHPVLRAQLFEHEALPPREEVAELLAAKLGVRDADPALRHASLARALEPLAAGGAFDPTTASAARVIERAYSTSDFAVALLSSADRTVLQGYSDAPLGVRAMALRRPLQDFRAQTMLRLSKFGSLGEKLEGGEYQTSSFSEENAATLQVKEYGRIAILARKALINDDLDIFGRLLMEMGASAARLEAELLAERLLNGFTWTSANSTTNNTVSDGIHAATTKLRRQTDVDGNRVSFEPRLLLVPPELEAEARQVLSDRYMPNTSAEVNAFPNIALEVDAQLTEVDEVYLVDTNHPPLALGTIGEPVTTQEEDFSTGNRKLRVQHDAAAAVLDERSIVKITVT
jgi:hypothetical protein